MTVRILQGDCRSVLRTLRDESVHCVVTSPPYWGLRDYGVDGQMGLEASVEDWVAELVGVFREVRRVLRPDGTLWLNLGDSYAGSGRGGNPGNDTSTTEGKQSETARQSGAIGRAWVPPPGGLKCKDLIGQPWRLAFALQADGWWLRQDIIWHKPNPMPESIRDRCTKAHEYLFLLSKSERYWWDFDAMQEPVNGGAHPRRANNGVGFGHGYDAEPKPRYRAPFGWATGEGKHSAVAHSGSQEHRKRRPKAWDVDMGSNRTLVDRYGRKLAEPGGGIKNNTSMAAALSKLVDTRNRRSVWTVPTDPFREAHFATFPPALIEPCIKASCPEGGTVLDPFGGAGTTGLVADRLQRHALLIELNPAYVEIAERRIRGESPLFAEVAA